MLKKRFALAVIICLMTTAITVGCGNSADDNTSPSLPENSVADTTEPETEVTTEEKTEAVTTEQAEEVPTEAETEPETEAGMVFILPKNDAGEGGAYKAQAL